MKGFSKMDTNKLQNIVSQKNERLEREALNNAEAIIEQIAVKQDLIVKTTKEITELQEELRQLEIRQLDPNKILG